MGLAGLGPELRSETGTPLSDPGERQRRLEAIGSRLSPQRLPQLHSLGVFAASAGTAPGPAGSRKRRPVGT